MVLFNFTYFSRFILFGTVAGITFFEILTGYLYVSIQKSVFLKDWIGLEIPEEQNRVILPAPLPEVFSVLMRKLWLDELPMLLNVLKGDMKIMGVRPLSKQYFSLYSEELQKKRIKGKPGLIPPYYAQHPTPKTLSEIQENEMKYLNEYEKHPFGTDLRYFFKAMHNIIFRKARGT